MTEPARKVRKVPPLPNEAVHAKILRDLDAMSDEDFFASCVEAGILSPDGTLRPEYRGESAESDSTGSV